MTSIVSCWVENGFYGAAKKLRIDFFLRHGIATGGEGISQGLKPRSRQLERAKAKALAYLEARTTADAKTTSEARRFAELPRAYMAIVRG
jgi:hypothetical protein